MTSSYEETGSQEDTASVSGQVQVSNWAVPGGFGRVEPKRRGKGPVLVLIKFKQLSERSLTTHNATQLQHKPHILWSKVKQVFSQFEPLWANL